jgi:uncharacterized protein (DUF1810 family)
MFEANTFNLDRFVDAQNNIWPKPLTELQAGRKTTHWIWYVLPQLLGLGHSPMAQLYGVVSLAEARAYLGQPILSERLNACVDAVLDHRGKSLNAIFGSPDDMKFCSCMTLFALAQDGEGGPFRTALAVFCDGEMDGRTLALLKQQGDR